MTRCCCTCCGRSRPRRRKPCATSTGTRVIRLEWPGTSPVASVVGGTLPPSRRPATTSGNSSGFGIESCTQDMNPQIMKSKLPGSSLFELEHYLGDRLAAGHNLKRYTRTAMAWLAESQLRRRNRWTRHVQRLVLDPSEPNWVDAFSRWRLHVDRALSPSPDPPGRDPTKLMLYADRLDDGAVRWVLHDPTAAHAAIVNRRRSSPRTRSGRGSPGSGRSHRRSSAIGGWVSWLTVRCPRPSSGDRTTRFFRSSRFFRELLPQLRIRPKRVIGLPDEALRRLRHLRLQGVRVGSGAISVA